MASKLLPAALASLAVLALPSLVNAQSVYPTGTTIWDPGRTSDGYTLFVGQGADVVLIDMDGTVVNNWVSPVFGNVLSNVEPLDNGRILVFINDRTLPGNKRREVLEMDYDGNIVWSYALPSKTPIDVTFHHDMERLPNGNTMLLGSREILVPSISSNTLIDDFIFEIDPAGNKVWSWETWKHYHELGLDRLQRQLISRSGGDWAHANSIAVIPPNNHTRPDFAEGNIIVSQRYTNTFFIIDKATKEIVWRSGPDDAHLTWGQHYPYMIPLGLPGEGNILVFSNGSGTGYAERRWSPGQSEVLEIDPVTKTVVDRYAEGKRFWSDVVSGAERLPNGNTLICSGVKGRLFEVLLDGTIVWEYMSPFSTQAGLGRNSLVYRAHRVPYSWKP